MPDVRLECHRCTKEAFIPITRNKWGGWNWEDEAHERGWQDVGDGWTCMECVFVWSEENL